MTEILFDDDNDGFRDNYDDDFGNFDDNDKNDKKNIQLLRSLSEKLPF